LVGRTQPHAPPPAHDRADAPARRGIHLEAGGRAVGAHHQIGLDRPLAGLHPPHLPRVVAQQRGDLGALVHHGAAATAAPTIVWAGTTRGTTRAPLAPRRWISVPPGPRAVIPAMCW